MQHIFQLSKFSSVIEQLIPFSANTSGCQGRLATMTVRLFTTLSTILFWILTTDSWMTLCMDPLHVSICRESRLLGYGAYLSAHACHMNGFPCSEFCPDMALVVVLHACRLSKIRHQTCDNMPMGICQDIPINRLWTHLVIHLPKASHDLEYPLPSNLIKAIPFGTAGSQAAMKSALEIKSTLFYNTWWKFVSSEINDDRGSHDQDQCLAERTSSIIEAFYCKCDELLDPEVPVTRFLCVQKFGDCLHLWWNIMWKIL